MNYIKTLRDQLQDMGEGFVESLPSLAIAIFIVFLTWIVARFGARISDMIVGRTELRASLKTLIDTLVKLGTQIGKVGGKVASLRDRAQAKQRCGEARLKQTNGASFTLKQVCPYLPLSS